MAYNFLWLYSFSNNKDTGKNLDNNLVLNLIALTYYLSAQLSHILYFYIIHIIIITIILLFLYYLYIFFFT